MLTFWNVDDLYRLKPGNQQVVSGRLGWTSLLSGRAGTRSNDRAAYCQQLKRLIRHPTSQKQSSYHRVPNAAFAMKTDPLYSKYRFSGYDFHPSFNQNRGICPGKSFVCSRHTPRKAGFVGGVRGTERMQIVKATPKTSLPTSPRPCSMCSK